MIDQIVLQNFQSHRKTILNLDPHVNAIIGDSNSGKTAILRGLYWAVYNRPSGQSFISYWNRDKKSNPIKSTYVSILNNDYEIKRIRSDMNGYKIKISDTEERKLEAIGMDVPEQVTNLFNLGEVNIQRQMDQPFLLSESASEVARFFNREIRLDLIDRVLGNAEAKRRKLNNVSFNINTEISTIKNELENFSFLDEAEKLSKQLSKIETLEESIDEEIEGLESLQNDHKRYDKIIKNYLKISFDEIESLLVELKKLEKEESDINDDIEKLEEYKMDYREKANNIITFGTDIAKLEKQMPTVCPYCNKLLGEDKCQK